ncbi:MAG TPA: hypothetical protein VLA71_10995, partial [Algoriphagus sp.]|nr:hypothetical protein [Algoriphagus sp.]
KTEIHHQDEVSKFFWRHVHGDTQKAYTSTLAPSTPISDPNEAFEWLKSCDERFFAILKFIPETVEVLQLNGLRHLRIMFSEKENWNGQWLVP